MLEKNYHPPSGILLIDKPAGITSFAVVRRVRRALKIRKIGHLGTLDPFATGLLPLCLKEATKLVPYLMPEPKTYRAVVKFGEETDTQDLTGAVLARSDKIPAPEEIHRVAARFVGEIEQIPPMYSALHHAGERLYRLARRGEVVELQPRKVTIYRLAVEEVAGPRATITVTCSQGTYIRTLAADLGAALGCGGHLTALRRLAVGAFTVADALDLEALEHLAPPALASRIIPLGDCLPGMRALGVDSLKARRLRQGQALTWTGDEVPSGELVKVVTGAELVALAAVRSGTSPAMLAPVRIFPPAAPGKMV